MELLERDRVSEYLKNLFKGYISDGHRTADVVDMSAMVQCVVRDTPSVEAEPVRYAHWEEYGGKKGNYWCTGCGMVWRKKRPTYCPHCGARMFPKEEPTDDQ